MCANVFDCGGKKMMKFQLPNTHYCCVFVCVYWIQSFIEKKIYNYNDLLFIQVRKLRQRERIS